MRLSVRRRLPGGVLSDVVGDVVSDDGDLLVLQPEDGPLVEVARADVAASRRVPPQAVRPSSSPEKLRRLLGLHWPGTETARLGGWVLHAGHGFTRRANSTLVAGDPGLPFQEALEHVRGWYAERGLPTTLVRLGPAPRGMKDAETATLVGDLRTMDVGDASATLAWSPEPIPAWSSIWRGGGHDGAAERAVLTAAPGRYGVLEIDGEPVGCVRVDLDRRWAHVSCVEIAPEFRGTGLGRTVTIAALREARRVERSTTFAVVDCLTTNETALGLYRSMGMREHHRYYYAPLEA